MSSHRSWLVKKLPDQGKILSFGDVLSDFPVNTVCVEARCPNQGECFERGVVTFLILGRVCTRKCSFCAVSRGEPQPVDPDEPDAVASLVKRLDLSYVVITSVTRDDLPDHGAGHFRKVVEKIREKRERTRVEVLIPDLGGRVDFLAEIISARPDVISHNLETVPRLYESVRPGADYTRSLSIIEGVKRLCSGVYSKSGIMLGLGESLEEVFEVMRDLRDVGCEILTVGQYLSPSRDHAKVARYVHPDEFEEIRQVGLEMGFKHVASGPYVRSSYVADMAFDALGKSSSCD